jgi:UMP-CMP kinase
MPVCPLTLEAASTIPTIRGQAARPHFFARLPRDAQLNSFISVPIRLRAPVANDAATPSDLRKIHRSLQHLPQSKHCWAGRQIWYEITCEDEMPPTDREWNVYKKGVAPAPKVVLHHYDPRLPCPKPNVVFGLGGPGAGKGTMCELAESQLGWTHLSMGDLLRAEYQAGGETAAIIEVFLSSEKLVPNEIIVRLLKETMERVTRTTGKNNFLLDGFPRSLSNLDGWFEIFGRETELPKMLYFECPYAVLEKRILGRAKYSGRSDDNVESMKQRFDTFKAETLPTVEFFTRNNKCVQVDTSQDRQTVYALVCNHLAEYTDRNFAARPLTERAEILLGLRAYPPSQHESSAIK